MKKESKKLLYAHDANLVSLTHEEINTIEGGCPRRRTILISHPIGNPQDASFVPADQRDRLASRRASRNVWSI